MSETDDIVVETRDGVGRFLLNRPKALNALTLDMVRAMQARLDAWATDDTVRAGVGPSVGAGGDDQTLNRAIEVLRRLEPYDLEFVEQPVIAEDLTGIAKIRRSVAVPIAADEERGPQRTRTPAPAPP